MGIRANDGSSDSETSKVRHLLLLGVKEKGSGLLCCIFNLILFNFGFSLCLIKCEYNDICAEFLSYVIIQLGCDMLIF